MQIQKPVHKINIKFIDGLILIPAIAFGKTGSFDLRCAIDTGCAVTTIRTDIIDALGYCAREAERISNVVSSSGKEQGYLIKIHKFSFHKIEFENWIIDAFDLPEDTGIDCLIGNDILSRYKVKIDYENEMLELEN